MTVPNLHMLCGKAAAGKSTLCAALAAQSTTALVIAQDHWMAKLYPEELKTLADYIRLVPRLRAAMGPHVSELLRAGLTIILDWPANTVGSRAWMRGIFESASAGHALHVLDVPDAVCRARLEARNTSGTHDFTVSPSEFDELARYFEPPTASEGFNVVTHVWR